MNVEKRSVRLCVRIFTAKVKSKKSGHNSDRNIIPFSERPPKRPSTNLRPKPPVTAKSPKSHTASGAPLYFISLPLLRPLRLNLLQARLLGLLHEGLQTLIHIIHQSGLQREQVLLLYLLKRSLLRLIGGVVLGEAQEQIRLLDFIQLIKDRLDPVESPCRTA